MGKWIKTILLALVVVFAIFYLYTRPEAAAGVREVHLRHLRLDRPVLRLAGRG